MSVWAIGDIHGQAVMLENLLGALPRQPADMTVFTKRFWAKFGNTSRLPP